MESKTVDEYEGAWLSTNEVPKFYFLNPNPDDIRIGDIANALSKTCRFGGHGTHYYSVAEHSVIVSKILMDKTDDIYTIMAGLLHDAEEAYLPDIPSPIKAQMPEARGIYTRLSSVIMTKYGCESADFGLIKDIDKRLCITEAKRLGLWNPDWRDEGEELTSAISWWNPEVANTRFLHRFRLYSAAIREKTKQAT